MNRKVATIGFASVLSAYGIAALVLRTDAHSEDAHPAEMVRSGVMTQPMLGNPEALYERYLEWKQVVQSTDPGDKYVFPLNYLRGVSTEHMEATGFVSLDLANGQVEAELQGLPEGCSLDLWFIDDRGPSGGSPLLEDTDRVVRIGTVQAEGSTAKFQANVPASIASGFEIDQVVASRPGSDLADSAVLFGGPTLFQRLYALEAAEERKARNASLALAIAAPIQLGGPLGVGPLSSLVAKGEHLFFNEPFKGNGRTCGTCHPIENNLTLDPAFIATLPNDDPLFVAEFVPALNADLNGGKRFENPVLMRKFALITENLDGFEDLKKRFVMRSIPHVFAQGSTILAGNGVTPPKERTGWGGDGAPSGIVNGIFTAGRLFDFPIGAVIQHFPKTTNRINNIDFVMPSNSDLVAMEAFQLSLGRQSDLDLSTLTLNDSEADIGRVVYAQSSCNKCHEEAGSGSPNFNFDTGVEEFLINNPDSTGEPRPADGGFGTDPNGLFPSIPVANDGSDPNKPKGSFGNGQFNTPSIVEAADTAAFFHNNIIDGTIEDAIDFYRSNEFIQAQGSPISFAGNGREQVGKFLRAINSMDNIDSSIFYAKRAHDATAPSGTSIIDPAHHEAVNLFLRFSIADIDDCIRVLTEVDLNLNAVEELKKARCFFMEAMAPNKWDTRRKLIEQGIEHLSVARNMIGN